jgi:MFS family permease
MKSIVSSSSIDKSIYFSVASLAAAALMLESTLTRLLAVAQYYHFAFLVVSLALLGFGASGSFLTIFPGWYRSRSSQGEGKKLSRLLVISGFGFTLGIGLSFVVVNWLPFDSYSIAWDPRQVLYFALYYLVLTIPFVFAGLGIGAGISISSGESNQVYAVNLLGSAVGILLALIVMQLAGVPGALLASGMVGLIAALGSNIRGSRIINALVLGALMVGTFIMLNLTIVNSHNLAPLGVTISPYKGLPYALRIPGSEKLFGAWNAISRLDVLSGASTRVMPGLSYTYQDNPPPQLGMAVDGDTLQPITLIEPENFTAANYLPEAIAYKLQSPEFVLVLESGAGLGVAQALAGGAGEVTAVLDNSLIIKAVSQSAPNNDVYKDYKVDVSTESSRVYLGLGEERFDVIHIPLNDPYRPVASGAYSLSENFTLTVEAFVDMISNLTEDGVIVVTRWLQMPPSESLRLLATLIEALERSGINNPEKKIVAYRGIQTITFLVKTRDWQDEQLALVREFVNDRRFDLVWSVDIAENDINRFNKLQEPIYFNVFSELITASSKENFYNDYPFSIKPATDDHPFFFHFFKWEQTPQILATIGRVWQPFGGSGYFVLLALLILVSGLSVVLIILPLWIKRIQPRNHLMDEEESIKAPRTISTWRILIYFGSIGLAFLFLEIPLIQKSILSMEHPTYAFALIVLALLVFSSVGSYYSNKFLVSRRLTLIILFGLALVTPLVYSLIQGLTLNWPLIPRAIILGLSLAPVGFFMGMPFPMGLVWLEESGSSLVPWAWAVNGCASVMAAVLAAIIVLSSNFSTVLILGGIFYGLAALAVEN